MKNFYEGLSSFNNFNEITHDSHFHALPQDWYVIITDIKGSTKAIAEGRYKDVNTIGAASIVVTRKAMQKSDFPFVFGGDGATILVPGDKVDEVCNELCALKVLAQKNFSMQLRVGKIQASELYAENKKIEVARYELTKGRHVSVLRGEGVNLAEEKIKGSEKYEEDRPAPKECDLTGLSCRWQPIPSKHGKILSILISARKQEGSTYSKILAKMEEIFPEGIEGLNPAASPLKTYKSIWQCMRDEHKYHPSVFSPTFIKRFLEIFVAVLIFKFNFPNPIFDSKKYANSMQTHSDFRKFDNMLRMVIDCSKDKVTELKLYLESLYQAGDIFYGLHESDNSLMTCFVEGLNQGEHIHFMDAENGGYAAAAIQLKDQIKKNRS